LLGDNNSEEEVQDGDEKWVAKEDGKSIFLVPNHSLAESSTEATIYHEMGSHQTDS
jgi:hypothetical protein